MAYSKPRLSSRSISLIDTWSLVMSMPKVMERLAWGSRSITSTRASLSRRMRPAARLTAVVVFPVPPFILATATMRGMLVLPLVRNAGKDRFLSEDDVFISGQKIIEGLPHNFGLANLGNLTDLFDLIG